MESDVDSLVAMAHDAERLLRDYRFIIEKAPLQVYASALVFSPRKSLVAELFWSQGPDWIERCPYVEDMWRGSSQWFVNDEAYSPTGQWLASACDDHQIDRSGRFGKLQAHANEITAMTFSPNGQILASTSTDMTILWNVETGAIKQRLGVRNQRGRAIAMTFSPNSKLIACTSSNMTLGLWNTETGAIQYELEDHIKGLGVITFSPNSLRLAFASGGEMIRIYKADTGVVEQMLKGHDSLVSAMAFSPGGQYLASASIDDTIRLWDVDTGEVKQTLEANTEDLNISPFISLSISQGFDPLQELGSIAYPRCLTFSPDGKWIASISNYAEIQLWHKETEVQHNLRDYIRHDGTIEFSPDRQHLITSVGLIELPTSYSSSAQHIDYNSYLYWKKGYGDWIWWNDCPVLWPPMKYRPKCQAFHDNALALGLMSGLVAIIKFKKDVSPIS